MYILATQTDFNELDQNSYYWTDGKTVFFRSNEIVGADIESFRFYTGPFAKDKARCYLGNDALEEADQESFEGINLSFARDRNFIWCASGKIDQADPKTFEVCDAGKFVLPVPSEMPGKLPIPELKFSYGYAKDKNRVYYFSVREGLSIIHNADPCSFISLNDGYFAYDKSHVFCQAREIEDADPNSWQRYGHGIFYSRGLEQVYYLHRKLQLADIETFEIVYPQNNAKRILRLAQDQYRHYWNGMEITTEEFEALNTSQQLK